MDIMERILTAEIHQRHQTCLQFGVIAFLPLLLTFREHTQGFVLAGPVFRPSVLFLWFDLTASPSFLVFNREFFQPRHYQGRAEDRNKVHGYSLHLCRDRASHAGHQTEHETLTLPCWDFNAQK